MLFRGCSTSFIAQQISLASIFSQIWLRIEAKPRNLHFEVDTIENLWLDRQVCGSKG